MAERNGKADVQNIDGDVFIMIPGGGYIKMIPEQARKIATALFRNAAEAEGLQPPSVIVFQDRSADGK